MTQYGNRDLGEEYQQGIFDMLKGAKDLWLESGMGLLNPNNPTVKHFSNPSKGTTLPSLLDDPAALESLSLDPGGLGFMRGMTKVFHGSPHLFDSWNFKKIGFGEGVQAYGYGGYFAGDKRVGQYYVDALSDTTPLYMGVPLKDRLRKLYEERDQFTSTNPDYSIPENLEKAQKFADETGRLQFLKDLTEKFRLQSASREPSFDRYVKNQIEASKNYLLAEKYNRNQIIKYEGTSSKVLNPIDDDIALIEDRIRHLEDLKPGQISLDKTGHLYDIELKPDPEDFLDWSKPLSDQSPAIKTKLSKFFDKSNKSFFKDVYDDWQRYLDDIPEEAQTIAKKMVADEISITDGKTWTRLGELAPDADHNMIHNYRDYAFGFGGPGTSKMTGEAFYRRLEDVMGAKQAPDALSSEGIYGHRYEDAMSRGGRPAKNYNYVVYPTQDPEMIKIMNPPSLID
jgi:hypothetical protein